MFCRKCGKTIDDESSFCRFCGTEVVPVVPETSIELEYRQNSELYDKARELMSNGNFEEARRILLDLSGFRNADELAERCITGAIDYRRRTTYEHAVGVLNNDEATKSDLIQAAEDLEALGEYENAEELAEQCRSKVKEVLERTYRNACELLSGARTFAEMLSACEEFEKIGSYKDSFELAQKGRSQLDKYKNYDYAIKCFNEASNVHQYMDVIEAFRTMGGFLDSEEMCCKAVEKIYSEADKAASKDTTDKLNYAAATFEAIKTYKDAEQRASECRRRSDEIIAERKEKARREAEEADELEFQYCKKILSKPDAQIAEIEEAEGRLYLIKDHEGAEAAIEECKQRHESLQKKGKRNTVIGIIVVSAIAVLIVLSLIFVNAILPAIKYSNAQSLAEQGRYSEAAEEYSNLKEYKDSREMAAKMRAQSCVEQGKIDEAASLLYSANLYDLANECLKTEFNRLVSEGKNDEAIVLAAKYDDLNENGLELCNEILDELLKERKFDEALGFCREKNCDESTLNRCYLAKAEYCRINGQWIEAAEEYTKGGSKEEAEKCYAAYADKCFNNGDYLSAEKYYALAQNDNKRAKCYAEYGRQCFENGQSNKALTYFQSANDTVSSSLAYCFSYIYECGNNLAQSGDYSLAKKYYDLLGVYKQSYENSRCCRVMEALYSGDYNISYAKTMLEENNSDLAKNILCTSPFTGAKEFENSTNSCYVGWFYDSGGYIDVPVTSCFAIIDSYVYTANTMWINLPLNSSELDRMCRSCHDSYSSRYELFYDPDNGFYISDYGYITKLYIRKTADGLYSENRGFGNIYDGTYIEYYY